MLQLSTPVNSALYHLKPIRHLFFILFLLLVTTGCQTPSVALIPGQTKFSLQSTPLIIFTLELSQFEKPKPYSDNPWPAVDLHLSNNDTHKRNLIVLWRSDIKKGRRQDFHDQIITLRLAPGFYKMDWLDLNYGDFSIRIPLNRYFVAKARTVSYIANINAIYKGYVPGVRDLLTPTSFNDRYDEDINRIKREFPCLKNIDIEHQFMSGNKYEQ